LGEKFIRQRREPSIAHKKNPARAGFLVQIRWARSLSASGGSPVLPTILTMNVRIFFTHFFNQNESEKFVVTEQRARQGREGVVCELHRLLLI
jgi:hypothetical protein